MTLNKNNMDKKVLKKRFASEEQALAYIECLSMSQIKDLLVEFMTKPEPENNPKIVITEEQFRTYFRIKGLTETGEIQTKGRPKKDLI